MAYYERWAASTALAVRRIEQLLESRRQFGSQPAAPECIDKADFEQIAQVGAITFHRLHLDSIERTDRLCARLKDGMLTLQRYVEEL